MTWCKEPTHWKRPWCWERLKGRRRRGPEDEMIRHHHRLNWQEFEETLGVGDGQGSLACCSPWGGNDQTRLSAWTTKMCKSQQGYLCTFRGLIFQITPVQEVQHTCVCTRTASILYFHLSGKWELGLQRKKTRVCGLSSNGYLAPITVWTHS